MKIKRRDLLKTGMGAAALTLAAPTLLRAQAGALTIGVAGPITGPNAAFGE
jgi:ABC-type branched-subunit amino acid transport system substrate-binding protein